VERTIHRFRFTIRDLLWLTLVVAMAVGWWIDRTKLDRRLVQMERELPAVFRPEQ